MSKKDQADAGGDRVHLPDDKTLIRQVAIFARRLQADYMHRIKRTGLTASQANALRELYSAPCSSQVELARRMEVGKAHAGQVLKSLEDADLITRNSTEGDRRSIQITLTAKGEAVVAKLASAAHGQQSEVEDALGATLANILSLVLVEANKTVRPGDDTGEIG